MSGAFGIMYHHFHGGAHKQVEGSISAGEFSATIKHLRKTNNILSADEWMEAYLAGKLSGNDICITFDDGLRCQYDVAKPVLDAEGIKAFFFIYTSPILGNLEKLELYRYFKNTKFKNSDEFYEAFYKAAGNFEFGGEAREAMQTTEAKNYHADFSFYTLSDRVFRYVRDKILEREKYFTVMDEMIKLAEFPLQGLVKLLWMTPQNIKQLADDGHIIGMHSHTHPTAIGDLSKAQQQEEYATNKAALEKITGKKMVTASHPSNSYSAATLELFDEMGIKIAFRANMKDIPGKYTIPREDHIIIHRQAQAA